MQQTSTILGLLAQTSIHAGTGQQTGAIDLPIQREGHNGWPCIFGSAVKGALRTRAEQAKLALVTQGEPCCLSSEEYLEKVQMAADIKAVYGSPTSKADDHASAIIVTDARLLLFPVRSLTSQFKWVTCPAAIRRYQIDCQRLGIPIQPLAIPTPTDSEEHSTAIVDNSANAQDLFLEEYRFKTETADFTDLIESLAGLMGKETAQEELKNQLVIISNDSFAHIVSHATPVNAHIAIDSQNKTVIGGALWYEETLPPETLLYVGIGANNARNKEEAGAVMAAEAVLGHVLQLFKERAWLQLGGNETVGMGWCAVTPVAKEK